MDILATVLGTKLTSVDGINPYWKLSLIFKCLTDAIMLDDFKTELARLSTARQQRESVDRLAEVTPTRVEPGQWTQKPTEDVPEGIGRDNREFGQALQIEDTSDFLSVPATCMVKSR